MKLDGVRGGSSSDGVVVPLSDDSGAPFDGEDRIPERMAVPRVP
jgi:hypothetical protein